MAIAGTSGRLHTIIQYAVWFYADGYDLAGATVEQQALVADLRTAVDSSQAGTSVDPIEPADVIFAAAPDPAVVRLVVVPPSGPATATPVTPPATLIPAVTTIRITTTVPTTEAPLTATTEKATATSSASSSSVATTTSTTANASSSATSTSATTATSTTGETSSSGLTAGAETDPTVMGAVQERSPLRSIGSTSTGALWAGVLFLTAGVGVAFLAARRAINAER
ncbi:MAG: hypothetical protein R2706_12545 [Acidimicrobiales bacterium]